MTLREHWLSPPCTKQGDASIAPRLIPLFGAEETDPDQVAFLWRQLCRILPESFFFPDLEGSTGKKRTFPKVDCVPVPTTGAAVKYCSFLVVAKYRPNAFKFFFEMITRWVVPGKRLDAVSVYAADFLLPDISLDRWTFCEVKIALHSREEWEQIQKFFPSLAAEIGFGMESELGAQRVLELKGCAYEEKTIAVHEHILSLITRHPKVYDLGLLREMQHVLVASRDVFKGAREPRHLSRLISLQYLLRKMLQRCVEKHATRRYLYVKPFKSWIQGTTDRQPVLAVLIGCNFFAEQELLREEQLFQCVQSILPSTRLVPHSFFSHQFSEKNLGLFYLEIEKERGEEFNTSDMRKVKRDLPLYLKSRTPCQLHDLFMPKNEEEVLRDLLTLSEQLRSVQDKPQIMIQFDAQSHLHLHFTILFGRVIKKACLSLFALLQALPETMLHTIDRIKTVGLVRRKYPKEMAVVRLSLYKTDFLRPDQSVDLYKARQTIIEEWSGIFGEIRDYNGGMLSKEREVFCQIRAELIKTEEFDDWFLEKFFYSLTPSSVRSLVDPHAFAALFRLLLQALREYRQEETRCKRFAGDYNAYCVVLSDDVHLREQIEKQLQSMLVSSKEFVFAYTTAYGLQCFGSICCAKTEVVLQDLVSSTLRLLS